MYRGLRFSKNNDNNFYNKYYIILAFFPGISLFIFIFSFIFILYLGIEIKKILSNEKNDKYDTYKIIVSKYPFMIVLYIFFIIMFSKIFYIYNIYLIIIKK